MADQYSQTPPIQFLGTDALKVPAPQPPLQQATPSFESPSLNQSIQRAGELANYVSQSRQANAGIAKQSAEAMAEATVAYSTDSNSYKKSGWGEIADLATGMYSVWQELEKEKAKRAKAEKEALRGQYLPEFFKNVEGLVTQADSIIRGEGGYQAYIRKRDEIFDLYKDYLEPDDLVKAYGMVEQPAQSLSSKFGEQLAQQVKETKDIVIEKKTKELTIQLIPHVVKMSSSDGELRKEGMEDYFSAITEATKGLDERAAAKISADLLAFGQNYLEKGTAAQLEFIEKSQKFQTAVKMKNEAEAKWRACGNSADCVRQYQSDIGFIESQTGIRFNENPYQAENLVLNAEQTIRDAEEARLDNTLVDGELQGITNAMVGDAALYVATDPAAEVALLGSTKVGKNHPVTVQRIVELSKAIKKAREELPQLTLQQQRLQQSVATSQLTELQDILSWMRRVESDNALTTALEKVGVAAQINSDVSKQIQAILGTPTAQRTPQQQQELIELSNRVRVQFDQVRKAMVEQVKTVSEQKENILRPLALYGLLEEDKQGNVKIRKDLQKGQKSYNETIKRVQDSLRQKKNRSPDLMQPSTIPSNFRMPQLKAVPLGGNKTAILPFKADAEVRISSGLPRAYTRVNTAHWEHQHNPMPGAVDFTLEDAQGNVKVPLYAPFDGTVVEAIPGDGRAGNSVVVQDSTTGMRFRVLHLDKPSTLKPGDKVLRGQTIIGIQGETGDGVNSGTGANVHTHIEVYRKNWEMETDRSKVDRVVRQWVDMHMKGASVPKRIIVPEKTTVVHNNFGTVKNMARNHEGFWLEIQDPSGNITRYRGLGTTWLMKGGRIVPGQEIGKTNQNFVWEMFNSTGAKLDPLVASTQLPNQWRSAKNGTSSGRPRSSVQITGGYIQNGKITTNDGKTQPVKYTPANPLREGFASDKKSDYGKNDGAGNFGYALLNRDRDFRVALHRTSTRLGIPAQWLADIIAFETGGTFSTGIRNTGGNGATGLIQFMPGTARNLGTSTAELAAMSRSQQMRYVEKYLSEFKGRLLSPAHLLMAVWGGGTNLDKFIRNPASVRYLHDGYKGYKGVTFEQYLNGLGSHVGRQYMHPYRSKTRVAIHNKYHQGCSKCQNLVASGSKIIPHESYYG